MKLSTQIKPISYLKANAAEIMDRLAEDQQPIVITQNGEAKAVLQDVASYEKTQETLALLKIIALGQAQIARGEIVPARDAIAKIRTELSKRPQEPHRQKRK
ncbi:type II toxin-antitoxin system Phd/YefM family antitoxin [Dongia sp.]|uniref:type II toxin-antitoxin system Phd/YefM family antitoxin n=1 Tax=Dongia sp. TaxID=1977262 RepID=UPI0035B1DF8F